MRCSYYVFFLNTCIERDSKKIFGNWRNYEISIDNWCNGTRWFVLG